MQRPRIRKRMWRPVWNEHFQKWSASYIKKNLWRYDTIHEFDDLMQDAYLLFVRIADTYPRVNNPANFMALFKMAMINKTNDRSLYTKRRKAAEITTPKDVSEFYLGRIGEVTNAGYLNALLAEMPEELHLAMEMLSVGLPEEKTARSLNSKLCKALGIDPDRNLLNELKVYLTP